MPPIRNMRAFFIIARGFGQAQIQLLKWRGYVPSSPALGKGFEDQCIIGDLESCFIESTA